MPGGNVTTPLMSRIKEARERRKAIDEAERRYLNSGQYSHADAVMLSAGCAWDLCAQFLLTELSRAEEGHGPRVWRWKDSQGFYWITRGRPEEGDNLQEYAPLTELIASRAADLREVEKWRDEYTEVCKFATDYEQQRDELREKVRRLREALSATSSRAEWMMEHLEGRMFQGAAEIKKGAECALKEAADE